MPNAVQWLEWLGPRRREMVACLIAWAQCETPTTEPERVRAHARRVAAAFAETGCEAAEHADALELRCAGREAGEAPVIVLGHLDTVHAAGTLEAFPVREDGERLWGPGVYDMKGGIAQLLFALRALRAAGSGPRRGLRILLVFEEEIGSPRSQALTEAAAREGAAAALVLEPGADGDGKLKIARKGIGVYRVSAEGRPAHAGVDFTAGASAIVELAARVVEVAGWSDVERGLTVNPGLMRGGTRVNVVAEHAEAQLEARAWMAADLEDFDARIRALRPGDPRVKLRIEAVHRRPPMEPTAQSRALAARAQAIARDLGFTLESTRTGGGSDGSYTAALGVPTLDGLGAVGGGAHTREEHVQVATLVPRAALLAELLRTI